eukprot:scaffold16666_cov159-Isochrysis_galbana.AAC.1
MRACYHVSPPRRLRSDALTRVSEGFAQRMKGDFCGVLRRARPVKARSTRKEKGILWGAQRI